MPKTPYPKTCAHCGHSEYKHGVVNSTDSYQYGWHPVCFVGLTTDEERCACPGFEEESMSTPDTGIVLLARCTVCRREEALPHNCYQVSGPGRPDGWYEVYRTSGEEYGARMTSPSEALVCSWGCLRDFAVGRMKEPLKASLDVAGGA